MTADGEQQDDRSHGRGTTGLVEDKAVLVTGAGSGIGQETARRLAAEGARVFVTDVDGARAEATAGTIRAEGGTAEASACDVRDEDAVAAAVEACVARLGALDGAVNNAGISGPGAPLDEVPLAGWQQTLGVNLTGVFLCMKHEIAAMKRAGGGAIVNMASGETWREECA